MCAPRVECFALFIGESVALIDARDTALAAILNGLDPVSRNSQALEAGGNRPAKVVKTPGSEGCGILIEKLGHLLVELGLAL